MEVTVWQKRKCIKQLKPENYHGTLFQENQNIKNKEEDQDFNGVVIMTGKKIMNGVIHSNKKLTTAQVKTFWSGGLQPIKSAKQIRFGGVK